MTRVGLVLGAGGTVGQAYHAGVLACLAHDLGWDPRTADVVVGTSAGAVSGTLLRLGVPAHDLAAWAVRAPLSTESGALRSWLERDRTDFPPLTPGFWLRRWRLPPPALIKRVAARPWALRPSVMATAMMPVGDVDLTRHADELNALTPDTWPPGLRACAVRRVDGQRVVFGRADAPEAPVPHAVAASCAIPGYFAPIESGGREYFDGGVHSPTNADVVADDDLDLVIAIAPMSAAGGLPSTVDGPLRYAIHRRLERELRTVADRGTTVVRIEPSEATLSAMGVNMMANDRAEDVVQEAFMDTGEHAASRSISERLAPLAARPARQRAIA